MTQTMKASDARQQWSQVLNDITRKQKRVIVEKSGVPVAAIISPSDLERLNRMDAERERELDDLLARTRAAFADVPEEQLLEDVAAIIERDRQEQRKKADVPTSA